MKISDKIVTGIGVVSGVAGLLDIIIRSIKDAHITFSWYAILLIVIGLLSLLLIFLLSNKNIRYFLKSRLSYFLRHASYVVLEKECEYIYKSRTELKYKKRHCIQSKVGDLSSFSDKFKWSVEQAVDKIPITCEGSDVSLTLKRVENWHEYNVSFPGMSKGAEKDIVIILDPLLDPDKQAVPFLSSNIIHKTKKLILRVILSSELKPEDINYKIFDNYPGQNPIYEENLKKPPQKPKLIYDHNTNTISVEEEYPIWGYKYLINWKFDDETDVEKHVKGVGFEAKN